MAEHTQQDAERLAVQRRARRRTVSVEVEISEYVDVQVPMSKISTEDLIAELREREGNGGVPVGGDMDEGHAMFRLDVAELHGIRHLFLIGREVEAAARCQRLLADMLGTAL